MKQLPAVKCAQHACVDQGKALFLYCSHLVRGCLTRLPSQSHHSQSYVQLVLSCSVISVPRVGIVEQLKVTANQLVVLQRFFKLRCIANVRCSDLQDLLVPPSRLVSKRDLNVNGTISAAVSQHIHRFDLL